MAGSASTTRTRASASLGKLARGAARDGVELVPAGGLVESCAAVKDADEVEAIAEAAADRRRGLRVALRAGLRGAHRARGGAALPRSGCASWAPKAPRSRRSSPRAPTARCRTHEPGDARSRRASSSSSTWARSVDGYCSDCTRTFATGSPRRRRREVYELVRGRAGRPALEAVRAGSTAKDGRRGRARDHRRGGHGEHFGHGLGHGVGLEVHEAPRLAQALRGRPARPATPSPSSRASTCPAGSASGSRTSSSSPTTGNRNLSGFGKDLRVVD